MKHFEAHFAMPKFRKKPVEVEAIHYTPEIARRGWGYAISDAHPWLDEAYENEILSNVTDGRGVDGWINLRIVIKTLEGELTVSPGDWIIRGVKGELYPCKPDIFAATYEPADV